MAPHKGETAEAPFSECQKRAVGPTDRLRDDVERLWQGYDCLPNVRASAAAAAVLARYQRVRKFRMVSATSA
jgi:hypothetical protein